MSSRSCGNDITSAGLVSLLVFCLLLFFCAIGSSFSLLNSSCLFLFGGHCECSPPTTPTHWDVFLTSCRTMPMRPSLNLRFYSHRVALLIRRRKRPECFVKFGQRQ